MRLFWVLVAVILGACGSGDKARSNDARAALDAAGNQDQFDSTNEITSDSYDAERDDMLYVDLDREVVPAEPLSLLEIIPPDADHRGGQTVTFVGDGFVENGLRVFFDEVEATGLVVVSAQYANVMTPPHPPGRAAVTVKRWDGQEVVFAGEFIFTSELGLKTLSPVSGSMDGGETLTLSGGGFDGGEELVLGTRPAGQLKLVDAFTITFTSPGADCPGPADLLLVKGESTLRLPKAFTFTGDPIPERLSPESGPESGGTSVRLKGARFSPRDELVLGSTPVQYRYLSPFELEFETPPGHGVADLSLASPWGQAVLAGAFSYSAADNSLFLLSPAACSQAGYCVLDLFFKVSMDCALAQVFFGDVPAAGAEAAPEDGHMELLAPPAAVSGPVDVTVRCGDSELLQEDAFEYSDVPAIGRLNPASGSADGGETVSLDGWRLADVDSVRFGEVPVEKFSAVGEHRLDLVVPAHAPGVVDVSVTLDGVVLRKAAAFSFVAGSNAPELYAISPGMAAFNGGTLLVISGAGFTEDTVFLLDQAELVDIRVINGSLAYARTVRADAGYHDLTVRNGNGEFTMPKAILLFDPDRAVGGAWGGEIEGSFTVTVLEAGTWIGVGGALVVLTDLQGMTRSAWTDENGQATLSDQQLFGPQTLTVTRQEYDAYSQVDFEARNTSVYLIKKVESSSGGSSGNYTTPEAWISGRVELAEKYIPLSLGSCKKPKSGYCVLCQTPAECVEIGATALCLPFGSDASSYCTSACTSSADCPEDYFCLQEPGRSVCAPLAGRRAVYCSASKSSIYGSRPDPGPGGEVNAHGIYFIRGRVDQQAVVCFGGIEDPDTRAFEPVVMGITRNVKTIDNQVLKDVTVTLRIPLGREATLGFHGLPDHPQGVRKPYVIAAFDLGDDGAIDAPRAPEWDAIRNLYLYRSLPWIMDGPLAETHLSVYASVNAGTPNGMPYAVRLQELDLGFGPGYYSFDGKTATEMVPAPDRLIYRLRAAGDVLAALGGRDIYIYKDYAWSGTAFPGDRNKLFDIAFDDAGVLWAAGFAGLWKYQDGGWSFIQIPRPVQFRTIISWNGLLIAAGDYGSIVRIDPLGGGYALETWQGSERLFSSAAISSGVYLVGERGLVIWRNPEGLYAGYRLGNRNFLGIAPSADGRLLLTGEGGVVYQGAETSWFPLENELSASLRGSFVLSGRNYVYGDDGALYELQGNSTFSRIETRPELDLYCSCIFKATAYLGGVLSSSIGPFIRLPYITALNESPLTVSWDYYPGALLPTYQQVSLSDAEGAVFWRMLLSGEARSFVLPDLTSLMGVDTQPFGPVRMVMTTVASPLFDIDEFRDDDLGFYERESWALLFEQVR